MPIEPSATNNTVGPGGAGGFAGATATAMPSDVAPPQMTEENDRQASGVRLRDWLIEHERERGDSAIKWLVIRAVFKALDKKLHSKGVVHGDLHSENILVVVDDGKNIEVNFINFSHSMILGLFLDVGFVLYLKS